MISYKPAILILPFSIILAACTASEVGASKWAAGGAVAGATAGALFGHHEKAIYAASAGGAIAGGIIGYQRNKNNVRYCHYFDDEHRPYDAPCGKP
jgi:Predicted outer membrane lipoprotein